MSNTYFSMATVHPNFPNAAEEISLTAFVGEGNDVQITLGREYVCLNEQQATALALALLNRVSGAITATGNELYIHPLNKEV